MALVLLGCARAYALDGGAPAGSSDPLARATVAVEAISRTRNSLGLNYCSGVLIKPDVVVTAGHCINEQVQSAAVVAYNGTKTTRSPFSVAAVSRYYADPDLVADADFATKLNALSLDVAVLRLAKPIQGRAPVPLAHTAGRLPPRLILAGSGLSRGRLGALRTATLRPLLVTDSGLTIAVASRARVCVGDSGGPVVEFGRTGPRLWGVASAVITSDGRCGSIVIIAPAAAAAEPAALQDRMVVR